MEHRQRRGPGRSKQVLINNEQEQRVVTFVVPALRALGGGTAESWAFVVLLCMAGAPPSAFPTVGGALAAGGAPCALKRTDHGPRPQGWQGELPTDWPGPRRSRHCTARPTHYYGNTRPRVQRQPPGTHLYPPRPELVRARVHVDVIGAYLGHEVGKETVQHLDALA